MPPQVRAQTPTPLPFVSGMYRPAHAGVGPEAQTCATPGCSMAHGPKGFTTRQGMEMEDVLRDTEATKLTSSNDSSKLDEGELSLKVSGLCVLGMPKRATSKGRTIGVTPDQELFSWLERRMGPGLRWSGPTHFFNWAIVRAQEDEAHLDDALRRGAVEALKARRQP